MPEVSSLKTVYLGRYLMNLSYCRSPETAFHGPPLIQLTSDLLPPNYSQIHYTIIIISTQIDISLNQNLSAIVNDGTIIHLNTGEIFLRVVAGGNRYNLVPKNLRIRNKYRPEWYKKSNKFCHNSIEYSFMPPMGQTA